METKKLYGSFLLKKVESCHDLDWKETIEACGYKDSRYMIRGKEGWEQCEYNKIEEHNEYREFYENYILAAWKKIKIEFNNRHGDHVNLDNGISQLQQNDIPNLFTACVTAKKSCFLTPSFWSVIHGKSVLVSIELGGIKRIRTRFGVKLQFRTGTLKSQLLHAGYGIEELDYLSVFIKNDFWRPKKHWIEVFNERYPELPNALLNEELIAKTNELKDKQASRDHILWECGFYDQEKRKNKVNYFAYNFALRCSMSKDEVYFDDEGNRAHNKTPQNTLIAFVDKQDFSSQALPAWLEEGFDDEPETDSNNYTTEKVVNPTIQGVKQWTKLTGLSLLTQVLDYQRDNIAETSICIRCGYDTDKIGIFRKAFSTVADVKFGPLANMLREYHSRSILETDIDESDLFENAITEDKEILNVNIKLRRRDSSFRAQVLAYHGHECSLCCLKCEQLLEAAHIIPVANNGIDSPLNALVLCSNHHAAFDQYLLSFEPSTLDVCYKKGFDSVLLGVTKHKLQVNISNDALSVRHQLFILHSG